jgi:hypothetical protein
LHNKLKVVKLSLLVQFHVMITKEILQSLNNSPYAVEDFERKFCNSFMAARLEMTRSLYLRAKWFAAVASCNIWSLQNAIIEAKI